MTAASAALADACADGDDYLVGIYQAEARRAGDDRRRARPGDRPARPGRGPRLLRPARPAR
nr:hypothetical protein [Angustibacter aerolatus]